MACCASSNRMHWLAGACMVLLIHAAAPGAPQQEGWKADPKLQEEMQKKKVGWVYREEGVSAYTLPDALVCADGSRLTSKEQWEQKRRGETLELFAKHVYGRTPPRPAEVKFQVLAVDEKAMEGRATHKRVRITARDAGKSFAFEMSLMLPNAAKGRVGAFVLINNRSINSADPSRQVKDEFWPAEEILARGYAAAVFQTNDVDPDKNGPAERAKGVRGVWPGSDEEGWATIGAWAWGASRVLDYLQSDDRIDGSKVAVVGHSRGGKTALWAGAQDPRFTLVVSNDSGCGGAALSRRKFGETVAQINKSFPYWFCGNFKKFNGREEQLPIDQHQLMALIAPRALYVASADADFWADQRGEFLALAHAAPVYALYGFAGPGLDQMPALETPLLKDRVAYHIRRGGHGLKLYDWQRFMDLADKVWK